MRPIYFLVLLIITLKKAFASRTKDHCFTAIFRITRFSVRYDRLFLAEYSWAVSNISFKNLRFHLIHPFGRLNIPLMEQAVQLLTLFSDLLPVSEIPSAEIFHKFWHFISSLDYLKGSFLVLNSFKDMRIVHFGVSVAFSFKAIKVVMILFPRIEPIQVAIIVNECLIDGNKHFVAALPAVPIDPFFV